MKRLFFGLLVAATALGASAFTNYKGDAARFSTKFYQTGNGVYTDVAPGPTHSCALSSSTPCELIFPTETGLSTFNASQIPALSATYGTPAQSNPNKRYN